jgi:hypothetical protein
VVSLGVVAAAPGASALPSDCPALGAALVDHTCFHTVYGPFESVRATAGSVATSTTPAVDSVHTEYRVGLTGEESLVTYAPRRTGAWALFRSDGVPFSVVDAEGLALRELFAAQGDVGCSGLTRVGVFELTSGQLYRLVFGPTAARSVVLVIEYVDDFLIDNGRDADGDGYGTRMDVVRSPCAPPPGYVQNASDCDDGDPLANPGATELCDGLDQNCNGLADDEGLECRIGAGECAAVGALVCDGLTGVTVRCDATQRPPGTEVCNGKDDDCDGVLDGAELCAEVPEGPTCVREGFGAFCGCILDQDCGASDAGRVCDVGARRCIEGCSTEPGRNGCAAGMRCVTSGASLGTCREITDEPPGDGGGGDTSSSDPTEREPITTNAGCACRIGAPRGSTVPWALALAVVGATALASRTAGRLRRHGRWTR